MRYLLILTSSGVSFAHGTTRIPDKNRFPLQIAFTGRNWRRFSKQLAKQPGGPIRFSNDIGSRWRSRARWRFNKIASRGHR